MATRNEYDAGALLAEIRRDKAINTLWALLPLGCCLLSALALAVVFIAGVWTVVNLLTPDF